MITAQQLTALRENCAKIGKARGLDQAKTEIASYDPRYVAEALHLFSSLFNVEKDGFEYTLNHY